MTPGRDGVHAETALGVLDGKRLGRRVEAPFVSAVSKAVTREFAWSVKLVVIWTTWPLPCFSISATASCVIWKNPCC